MPYAPLSRLSCIAGCLLGQLSHFLIQSQVLEFELILILGSDLRHLRQVQAKGAGQVGQGGQGSGKVW